jgi:hypothetical protein
MLLLSAPVLTEATVIPEFTKNNQPELNAPDFADNLQSNYTLEYFGAGRFFNNVNIKSINNPNLLIDTGFVYGAQPTLQNSKWWFKSEN